MFVQACDIVSAVDEADLDLKPADVEARWEKIVRLTNHCKTVRGLAEQSWQRGTLKIHQTLCDVSVLNSSRFLSPSPSPSPSLTQTHKLK